MSVTFLAEYEKDPARAVRRQLEALWALDADRCAFIRQQRVGASTVVADQTLTVLSVQAEEPK